MKKNNLFIWCKDWSKAIRSLSLLKDSDIDFHKKINIINSNYDMNSDLIKQEIVDKKTIELKKYIDIQCLSLDELWDNKYNLLIEYVNKNSKIPTQKEEYNDIKIGSWVKTQREKYNKNKLNDERIKKLEEIQGWKWGEKRINTWDESYELLQDFIKENNKIPTKTEEYKDIKIGFWCSDQKKRYNKNKNKLNDERIKKLEEIQGWKWGEKRINTLRSWDESYELLIECVKENNKIPTKTEEYKDIKIIGFWCLYQKENYKKNKLNDERIKKLEEIQGWKWGEKRINTWDESYELLIECVKENNKIPTQREEYNDIKIGIWISHQRANYNKNRLNDERIKKLEEIRGWKWVRKN
jgi:sulfur transfer protein SufE